MATLALSPAVILARSVIRQRQRAATGRRLSTDGRKFTLTVGFDQGYPPYGYVGDDGLGFTGFEPGEETWPGPCAKMGWNLDLQAIDWDARTLIGSGTINCIWNGFTMEGA